MIESRDSDNSEMYRRLDRGKPARGNGRRPTCSRCLLRPEGIPGTELCHDCKKQVDIERAERDLSNYEPFNWKG